ncbi:hypothetical protein PSAC2689_110061 [Paraburkholderia sacchari]
MREHEHYPSNDDAMQQAARRHRLKGIAKGLSTLPDFTLVHVMLANPDADSPFALGRPCHANRTRH